MFWDLDKSKINVKGSKKSNYYIYQLIIIYTALIGLVKYIIFVGCFML